MKAARQSGAHALVAALRAAGVRRAFGVPGVHSLGIFEALRTSDVSFVGGRTELAAAFSADGHARRTGEPTALLVSTGPGTLMSLGGVLEARSAHVPVIVVSSQIARNLIGRRRGALHESPEQIGVIAPLVKWARRAVSAEQLHPLVTEAVAVATTPPNGPVYLEVPVDLLEEPAPSARAMPRTRHSEPKAPDLDEAAAILDRAQRPVVWAGGGVIRGGAWDALVALAERLDAPVATTFMGKGAIDARHPLSAGSACEQEEFLAFIGAADVVLAVGTELGAETTGQWTLAPQGRLIQIDASSEQIGSTYPVLPLIGDAAPMLRALERRVKQRPRHDGAARAHANRTATGAALNRGDEHALQLLDLIRSAAAWDIPTVWDMTILGYWAATAFPVAAGRTWLYPLGSGTLGYALPAALGASAAGARTLAVTGDGGAMYGLSELPTLAQECLPVTWLIIDDGGYAVLRHYQEQRYDGSYAVDLTQPDFVAMANSAGVPARRATVNDLRRTLTEAFAADGPNVVVLETSIEPPPGLS